MHRVHDRVECRLIDIFDRLCAIKPVGEAIERGLLVGAPAHDRFRALARGHVAGDFRGADDRAVFVPHRRHGERNVNQPAVLAAPDGLVVLDAPAGRDAFQEPRFLALEMIWNNRGDRFTDHLFGGISEQALSAGIPADDHAVEILADDDVVGGYHDAGELPARLFATALVGDIEERSDPAFDIVVGVALRPVSDGEPAHAAVRKFQVAFKIDRFSVQYGVDIGLQGAQTARADDFVDAFADDCIAVAVDEMREKVRAQDLTKGLDLTSEAAALCPACGARTQGAKFCPECGKPLRPKDQCSHCGGKVEVGTKFCPECGNKLT